MSESFALNIRPPETEFYESESDLCDFWNEVNEIFSEYHLTVKNFNFTILSDFSNLVKGSENDFFNGGNITIEVRYDYIESKYLTKYVVLSFIDNLFICSNLSFPGILNLYKTRIFGEKDFYEDFFLGSVFFESVWEVSKTFHNWPKIQRIPLKKVFNWSKSLEINLTPIAENNIERALYSLLEISNNLSNDNPTIVVWITNALEAVYNIKSGDPIIKYLKRRIFLHLGQSEHTRKINKSINEFYAYRSSFVHGDLKILRLGAFKYYNEEKISDYYNSLWKLINFGNTLLISTLQKMILQNYKELEFEEVLKNRKN